MDKEKYKVDTKSTKVSRNFKKSIILKYCTIIFSVLVILLFSIFFFARNSKYNEALKYLEQKKYDKGYEILEELGGTKSTNAIKESKYVRATEHINKSDSVSALVLLNEIKGYKDSNKIITKLVSNNDYLNVFVSDVGDILEIGLYEQDNDLTNGKEKVEWIFLNGKDGEYLLISKYILDVKKYNDTGDDNNLLNQWLSNFFAHSIFSIDELSIIKEIDLITSDEIDRYLDNEYKNTEFTKYALAKNPIKDYKERYMWWVDGVWSKGSDYEYATVGVLFSEKNSGKDNNVWNVVEKNGVRPVIRISVSDSSYSFEKQDESEFVGLDSDEKPKLKKKPLNPDYTPVCKNRYDENRCREGFYPCNPNKDNICVSCCKY